MNEPWFALQSKPRKEEALLHEVQRRGFHAFYPFLVVRPVNPRARHRVPYFPGYMFVQAGDARLRSSEFRWMPNAVGLVRFGGEPAAVPDTLIASLHRRVAVANREEQTRLDRFRPGDRVVIETGPFASYDAIFDLRLPGKDRVRVLLSLLHGRYVPVELSGHALELSTRI